MDNTLVKEAIALVKPILDDSTDVFAYAFKNAIWELIRFAEESPNNTKVHEDLVNACDSLESSINAFNNTFGELEDSSYTINSEFEELSAIVSSMGD